jgi:1,4-dihydroxy-2-naphthoate octaprenyltransferase
MKSTLQHLRFPFSFFLLPIFLFSLAQISDAEQTHVLLVFIILHFMIYPASNGYNSYHDQDTGPIGGVYAPLPISKYLLTTSLGLETLGLIISFYVNSAFGSLIFLYILGSHLYSHRKIRIKKYPLLSYISVLITQGALVYCAVQIGCRHIGNSFVFLDHLPQIIVSMSIIGAVYPLTQIYQHEQDRADGVTTISSVLGMKGTFYLAMVMMLICGGGIFYIYADQLRHLILFYSLTLPSVLMLGYWYSRVRRDSKNADFKHTMLMSIISSTCTNIIFLTFNIIQ